MRHARAVIGTVVAVAIAAFAPSAFGAGPAGTSHGYNSIPNHMPPNLSGEGAESNNFDELGNEIKLTGPTGFYPWATVALSSWACQSGQWYDPSQPCVTSHGATFSWPLTLNIYRAPANGANTPGQLLTSVTQTFSIRYRPSADLAHCTGPAAGEWYDAASKTCSNGLATTVRFRLGVRLPRVIVYGIAYNTTHYGFSPVGESASCFTAGPPEGGNPNSDICPYDALSIALSKDPTDVSVGHDLRPGTLFQYADYGPYNPSSTNYCDNGAAGRAVFRLDSPGDGCWSLGTPGTLPAYIPAVRFGATLSVGQVTTSGPIADVPLSCKGSAVGGCDVKLTLKATNPRGSTNRVIVGQGSAMLARGTSKTVKVALNTTGKQLLAKRHRLQSTLVVAQPPEIVARKVIHFHPT